MATSATLTVALSAEAARIVQRAVTSGEYPDVGAAVEAAVQGLDAQRDDLFGYTAEELDRLIDEGSASGPGRKSLKDIQREGFRLAGLSSKEA